MILHRYFARRFAVMFAGTFAVFLAFMALLDVVEQARRFGDTGAVFRDFVGLSLLNLPQSIYAILPLILILSTIGLFLALARSSEMVVTRAAGRSAMRALVAPVLVTLVIGIFGVTIMNPIVAATSKEYDARVGDLTLDGGNVMSITQSGLWLRQGSERGQTVIRAAAANADGTQLRDVSFITFSPEGGPIRRIEAARATLTAGAWTLEDAKAWPLSDTRNPEEWATTYPTLDVPSTLTADQIRDSFGMPSSIPIWELPAFIRDLQQAGFSARRHQVWLQMELALPAFLVSMVLIGAGFTMRHQRSGRTGVMVLFAILVSFGLYFIRNFAQVLGENGQIPVLLAVWAPPLAAIGLSLGLLLHLEDG